MPDKIKENADLIFEIGCEELPAGYLQKAEDRLAEIIRKDLSELKLGFEQVERFSTPRRLALKLIGLVSGQEDEIIERIGPAKSLAYDQNGDLSKAARGFLQSAGCTEGDIYT
ncbi:MAG: glycine--tRNA ligase subunit beta, partial [Candidatus Cloacimonetes bacterium]|nr:glycine--tRNA ligase subunit beta [Candidatus Cloacimonadota bacterium]